MGHSKHLEEYANVRDLKSSWGAYTSLMSLLKVSFITIFTDKTSNKDL